MIRPLLDISSSQTQVLLPLCSYDSPTTALHQTCASFMPPSIFTPSSLGEGSSYTRPSQSITPSFDSFRTNLQGSAILDIQDEALDEAFEEALFEKFPGWVWSERAIQGRTWVWQHGFDISKASDTQLHKHWVCKQCIRTRVKSPFPFLGRGTQNIMNHLFTQHQIRSPAGGSAGPIQKAADMQKPLNHLDKYLDSPQ